VTRIAWVWGPEIAAMVAIFAVSALPQPPAPEDVSDKTLHFLAYAGLGALLLRATANATWRGVSWRSAAWAWLIAAAYGASDEFHQYFVVDRTSSVGDWVADLAGAAASVAVITAVAALLRPNRTV